MDENEIKEKPNMIGWPDEIIKKFWNNVLVVDDVNQCWLWNGTCFDRTKYGVFNFTMNGIYYHYRAHRFSYELYNGDIPKGLLGCHTLRRSRYPKL